MKNLATMYKNLAPEERAAYEQKSNTLRAEYFKKKAEFEYVFHITYCIQFY